MRKRILFTVMIAALGLAACSKVSGPTDHKSSSSAVVTTKVAKTEKYSDEELAMAAFYKLKHGSVADDSLRVLTRTDGLFISDQDSDTRGWVMTVKAGEVDGTDENGAGKTFTKDDLRKLLKKDKTTYDDSLDRGRQNEQAAKAAAKSGASRDASASSSSEASSSDSATASSDGVDMKNLTMPQVEDWIMRNMQAHGTDYKTVDALTWAPSSDHDGQLVVEVRENHTWMNRHGIPADPRVDPMVGSFTVTSDGELIAHNMGIFGGNYCGVDHPSKVLATNFDN